MAQLHDDTPHEVNPPERMDPPGSVRFEAPYGLQKQCPHCFSVMELDSVLITPLAKAEWLYQCPVHGVFFSVRLQP